MLRADQVDLLRWAVALAEPHEFAIDPRRSIPRAVAESDRHALWASGLTAYLASLTRWRRAGDPELPDAAVHYFDQQYTEVVARSQRFRGAVTDVLRRLNAAGVRPTMVKGFTLSDEVWPVVDVRPMSDVDFVVDADDVGRVAEVFTANLHRQLRATKHEVVFELWEDGADPSFIGESRAHPGSVEVHPRWSQRAHGYDIGVAAVAPHRQPGNFESQSVDVLSPAARAVYTLCHLSAAVIRREVRPLNVLDTVFAVRALDDAEIDEFTALCDAVDARCTAPGLWLCTAFVDALVLRRASERSGRRLTAIKRRALAGASPTDVMRDPQGRYPLWWRFAWASGAPEMVSVVNDILGRRFRQGRRGR